MLYKKLFILCINGIIIKVGLAQDDFLDKNDELGYTYIRTYIEIIPIMIQLMYNINNFFE